MTFRSVRLDQDKNKKKSKKKSEKKSEKKSKKKSKESHTSEISALEHPSAMSDASS